MRQFSLCSKTVENLVFFEPLKTRGLTLFVFANRSCSDIYYFSVSHQNRSKELVTVKLRNWVAYFFLNMSISHKRILKLPIYPSLTRSIIKTAGDRLSITILRIFNDDTWFRHLLCSSCSGFVLLVCKVREQSTLAKGDSLHNNRIIDSFDSVYCVCPQREVSEGFSFLCCSISATCESIIGNYNRIKT